MKIILLKKLTCKYSLFYVLIFTVFLIAYIIAECFFREDFENYSDEIQIIDQRKYTYAWHKFLSFMTGLGYGLPLSIIVIFYYEVSSNKINAMILIFMTTFINYFLTIIKMLYHQPRPYMRNLYIIPTFKCGEEWGNPSGHAMNGFAFYFIVINSLRKRLLSLKFAELKEIKQKNIASPNSKPQIQFELKEHIPGKSKETLPFEGEMKDKICQKCKNNKNNENKGKNDEEADSFSGSCQCNSEKTPEKLPEKTNGKSIQKPMDPTYQLKIKCFYFCCSLFCFMFSFTIIALIGYSRFYFGLHSINQILLGWVYGLGFIVYFYYVFTNKKLVVVPLISFFESISNYKNNKFRIYGVIFNTFLLILFSIVPWIIFYVYESYDDINPLFITNMTIKCGEKFMKEKLLFYSNCFSDIGSIYVIFGVIYGILFSSGNYAHEVFWDNYYRLPIKKKIARLFFLGALAGIIFGIFSAVNFPENAYIICFLDNGLKSIIIGFLLVVLLPKIYVKLNLDVMGDFMREKEP